VTLPFSQAQFLDAFGAYNRGLWPVAALLWIATIVIAVRALRGRADSRELSALLAVQWGWGGVVYHAVFFSPINPAARLFAGLFVVQAALFVWYGFGRRRLVFAPASGPRRIIAGILVSYALAYPGLALLAGLTYPRTPTFGVPCPTTLFTAGALFLATPPVPRWLFVIPIAWAVVGVSAATVLGIAPDYMLAVAGIAMLGYAIVPGWFGAIDRNSGGTA
jgi:hypothetical protein